MKRIDIKLNGSDEITRISKMGQPNKIVHQVRSHYIIIGGTEGLFPSFRRIKGPSSFGPFDYEFLSPCGYGRTPKKKMNTALIYDLNGLPDGLYEARLSRGMSSKKTIFSLKDGKPVEKFNRTRALVATWGGDDPVAAYQSEAQTTIRPSATNPWYYASPANPGCRLRLRRQ